MNELEYFMDETLESIEQPLCKERILTVVCNHFNVTEEAIKGKARGSNLIMARHFYMFMLRDKGVIKTLSGIGLEVGKDHATVLYAVNKLQYWVKSYSEINEIYSKLNSKLWN